MLQAQNADDSDRIYKDWLKENSSGDYWSQYRRYTKL